MRTTVSTVNIQFITSLENAPTDLLEERVPELLGDFGLLFDVEYLDLHPVVQSG
jgi:hypothetical protein